MKTILHYYKFNLKDGAEEKRKHNELCEKLKAMGLKLFDSISPDHTEYYTKKIKPLDGKRITLDTEHLFNNQWNTLNLNAEKDGYGYIRIFDWSEAIYPNKSIKEGMWLEQTPDMRAIRRDTCRCGWCGKNYNKPEQEFCNVCLGDEHLKESDLFLLRLTSISEGLKNPKFTVPQSLITEYRERQRLGRAFRANKKLEDKKAELKKELEKANTEYRAMMALIEGGIDFDNVIYYPHTNEVCFGWRTPLTKAEEFKIKNALAGIMVKPRGIELSESVPFTEEYNVKFKTQ